MTDFEKMRSNMVKGQLLPNDITNRRLLRAFTEIPREIFVASPDQGLAYSEAILKVAPQRYLLKPFVLGKLLQAAQLEATFKVLDIAPATGYGPALLSYCVRSIIAVEENEKLFEKMTSTLDALTPNSIIPIQRSLLKGAKEQAPFDIIIIEGAVDSVPHSLFDQLNEGGKLLTFEVKDAEALMQAVSYTKVATGTAKRPLFECEASVLPEFAQSLQEFQF